MKTDAKKLLNDIADKKGGIRFKNRYGAVCVLCKDVKPLLEDTDVVDISIDKGNVKFRWPGTLITLYSVPTSSVWTAGRQYHA